MSFEQKKTWACSAHICVPRNYKSSMSNFVSLAPPCICSHCHDQIHDLWWSFLGQVSQRSPIDLNKIFHFRPSKYKEPLSIPIINFVNITWAVHTKIMHIVSSLVFSCVLLWVNTSGIYYSFVALEQLYDWLNFSESTPNESHISTKIWCCSHN